MIACEKRLDELERFEAVHSGTWNGGVGFPDFALGFSVVRN
jgi:hypothetical protein